MKTILIVVGKYEDLSDVARLGRTLGTPPFYMGEFKIGENFTFKAFARPEILNVEQFRELQIEDDVILHGTFSLIKDEYFTISEMTQGRLNVCNTFTYDDLETKVREMAGITAVV